MQPNTKHSPTKTTNRADNNGNTNFKKTSTFPYNLYLNVFNIYMFNTSSAETKTSGDN